MTTAREELSQIIDINADLEWKLVKALVMLAERIDLMEKHMFIPADELRDFMEKLKEPENGKD